MGIVIHAISHNLPPNNGIWCPRIMPFSYTNFQQQKNLPTVGGGKPPSHTPPPPGSVASLPRFDPPRWQIMACTTVTDIAKGHAPPLIWIEDILERGNRVFGIMPLSHITYPLIMAFDVQENGFHTQIFKNLPTVGGVGGGGEYPPPIPLPRSVASLPHFGNPPCWENPGYASVNKLWLKCLWINTSLSVWWHI